MKLITCITAIYLFIYPSFFYILLEAIIEFSNGKKKTQMPHLPF